MNWGMSTKLSSVPPDADAFAAEGHTPMMAQYMAVKAAHPDCLLFYRMGDFYEMFFEDAEKAAAALDIALTRRGKTQGSEIPMCGVPFHAHESYLARLIRAGFRVAICDQIETPEEARRRGGHKALIRREITRIVTPGTLIEDSLLDAREDNPLVCLAPESGGKGYGFACLEMSTGAFITGFSDAPDLPATLARLRAREILVPETLGADTLRGESLQNATIQPASLFDLENSRKRLESAFDVAALDSFGDFTPAEITAAGVLIDYAARTQGGRLPHIERPRRSLSGGVMAIDPATRRNLEIHRTLSGDRKGSLLYAMDRTVTGPGARMLSAWLAAPLLDPVAIDARLDRVECFVENEVLRATIRTSLKTLPDIERAVTRLSAGRGGPHDLSMIRAGLSVAAHVRPILMDSALPPLNDFISALSQPESLKNLAAHLDRALVDDPPFSARDGGFIQRDFNPELDALRLLKSDGRKTIAQMESQYRADTGVDSLKITYNNVLGYFLEVPARRADALSVRKDRPDNPYVHRQTMANAVRFTTPELSDLERRMASAESQALAIELSLFADLTAQVEAQAGALLSIARTMAELDVAAGLAERAAQQNDVRPVLTAQADFCIEGGRHPVVELSLQDNGGRFVPNDCDLGTQGRLWLLTGPNMAGKSTFLRQNALITLMAQTGAFVPAKSARIGVVDRLFSRVGASDDLARGHSTFMVEMVETATILAQATDRSLVILDEIGRGTATFDGLSIAWACVEHLHNIIRCRALFATHYHELAALESDLPALSNHAMQVREWKGDIVFLHAVAPGSADRSYGIHVARLAGLPPSVVARAKAVLARLSREGSGKGFSDSAGDLPLFSNAPAENPVTEKLKTIRPDDLSPKDALDLLYELTALAKDSA